MIFKGNISCYILLLKSLLTLENTKFIAGELSLKISLVLYLPTGHYEPWWWKKSFNTTLPTA